MTETKQTQQTEQKDRDENGQFLPGNSLWGLHAWEPGNDGRPNLFTPIELRDKVIQYVEDRQDERKTITLSGLRCYLGLSASGLRAYAQGEIGHKEKDKLAYVYVLDQFNGYMEDEAECLLSREKGSIDGIKFRMKNMWPSVWRDSKYISVDTNERRTIQIIVGPDSALTQRLEQVASDGNIQFIEHTGEGGE